MKKTQPTGGNLPPYITPAIAADLLYMSDRWVYQGIKAGTFPGVKFGGSVRIPTRPLVERYPEIRERLEEMTRQKDAA